MKGFSIVNHFHLRMPTQTLFCPPKLSLSGNADMPPIMNYSFQHEYRSNTDEYRCLLTAKFCPPARNLPSVSRRRGLSIYIHDTLMRGGCVKFYTLLRARVRLAMLLARGLCGYYSHHCKGCGLNVPSI